MAMLIDADGMEYGSKARAGDAGTDLAVTREVVLGPGDRELVGTGAYVDVASGALDGGVGLVFGRSSLGVRGVMLANAVGVVDSRYTGEILVNLVNLGEEGVRIEAGERVAQFVAVPIMDWNGVGLERGDGGHGSSNL